MGGSKSSNQPAYTWREGRFAPYIEEKHSDYLNVSTETRKAVISSSPYASHVPVSPDDAFLSIGKVLSSYPSMYDSFGKFMAGVDVDELFSNTFSTAMSDARPGELVLAESSLMNDAVEQIQQVKIGARDIGAYCSSTMILSQANVESSLMKKLAELRLSVKVELIPGIFETWANTLNWNKAVAAEYAQSIKDYYLCKIQTVESNYNKAAENTIWPMVVLSHEMPGIMAMRGTKNLRTATMRGRSDLSKALLIASYTLTGAQLGSVVPGIGTVVGAVIGFIVGVAITLLE